MVDDDGDIEGLQSTVRVLRVAIDDALDRNAPIGVVEALALQLLERERQLARLTRPETVVQS
jgi:hypothetical protein